MTHVNPIIHKVNTVICDARLAYYWHWHVRTNINTYIPDDTSARAGHPPPMPYALYAQVLYLKPFTPNSEHSRLKTCRCSWRVSDEVKRRSEGLSFAPVLQAKSSLKYPYNNFIFLLSWQNFEPCEPSWHRWHEFAVLGILINRNWTAERKTAGKFPNYSPSCIILFSSFQKVLLLSTFFALLPNVRLCLVKIYNS